MTGGLVASRVLPSVVDVARSSESSTTVRAICTPCARRCRRPGRTPSSSRRHECSVLSTPWCCPGWERSARPWPTCDASTACSRCRSWSSGGSARCWASVWVIRCSSSRAPNETRRSMGWGACPARSSPCPLRVCHTWGGTRCIPQLTLHCSREYRGSGSTSSTPVPW